MRGEIARSSGWDGENWQVRTQIAAEHVCKDHRDTALAELFWYWQERSVLEGAVPSAQNFRFPGEALPWVDVTTEDPLYFLMHNHPAGICGDWNATRFIEYPVTMHGVSCALEYNDCKELKEPVHIHIHQKIRGVLREYAKLMVPVADAKGEVTKAIYPWRFLRYPLICNS